MKLFALAWPSLRYRRASSALTLSAITLSVALLLGIGQLRTGLEESFSSTVSEVDLVVGARSGRLQLILASVFGIGAVSHTVSMETFERYSNHEAVAWTIPYALGDNYRGFRVIGTDDSFYRHFRRRGGKELDFAAGGAPAGTFDAVLGHQVAAELGLGLGVEIVISHGLGTAPGLADHGEKPFQVAGVLARTATPVDQAVYVTLEGLEAAHHEGPPEEAVASSEPAPLSAFFVATRSRLDSLRLQREINEDPREPLMAVLPGVALSELWRSLQVIEGGLEVILVFVVGVAFLSLLVAIYSSLQERRREMAVLRSLGARPWHVLALLVAEALLLSGAGAVLGLALNYGALAVARPLLQEAVGLSVPLRPPGGPELLVLLAVVLAGPLASLFPAWKACRNALADGLAPQA